MPSLQPTSLSFQEWNIQAAKDIDRLLDLYSSGFRDHDEAVAELKALYAAEYTRGYLAAKDALA